MTTTGPSAGATLRCFADAIDARDWDRLLALLGPDFSATLVHTGESFDREGFVAFNADYPGQWHFHADEVVDAGDRAVLRAHTTDGAETFHVASFASTADGLITDLVEVWTEAVAAHPARSPFT
ncbi:nuclear transport factor 2 family protein [Nocardioides sp.]|uniref:nuclear transport factor 2 family protein n=1 Tax=Nocardioides sp. TaxID=35761 RepID=UPI00286C2E32|nr:nuclear transport factor 2 family protein [Nocardioides sp.]